MAGIYTAPWLEPQNFIGASEAGARLGLSRAQMLEAAHEKEAELALQRDELSARMAAQERERQSQQNRYDAAMALREAALRQQGLLGTQRNENQAQDVQARDALDKAREDALNRQGLKAAKDSHFQDISRQAAAAYKAANPDVSNAELMSRFPMAFTSNSQIPTVPKPPKAPAIKPVSLLTPGIQDKIFDTELANGGGGTNVDYAIGALNKYRNPSSALQTLPYTVGQDDAGGETDDAGGETNLPDAITNDGTTPSAASALQPLDNSGSGLPDFTGMPAPSPIPQAHIDYLLAHPGTTNDFDAKYGQGASQQYIKPPTDEGQ